MATATRHQENAYETSSVPSSTQPQSSVRPPHSRDGSYAHSSHIRERRPRARDDGLLRSTNTYGNFQDFRCVRRRSHLLRWPNLRWHSDDEWSLSRCNSRSIRCAVWSWRTRVGCWLDWLTYRPVNVSCHAHNQAGRAVTNQSSAEQTKGQARPRPLSMDGDRIRHGNGFPRRVPNDCHFQFPDDGGRCMAHRPQTPEDVPTMGPEPQPEE